MQRLGGLCLLSLLAVVSAAPQDTVERGRKSEGNGEIQWGNDADQAQLHFVIEHRDHKQYVVDRPSRLDLTDLKTPARPFYNTNPRRTASGETLYQADMVLATEDLRNEASGRKAINDDRFRWPKSQDIKYRITSTSAEDAAVIRQAIQHWQNHTCLTFQEVDADTQISEPHLYFANDESGCWSSVGRIFWKEGQKVHIGRGCAVPGIVEHEIGHAMGFFHEHSRSDRDSYVQILTENAQANSRNQFARQTDNNMSVPYDYTSVMHYGRYLFTEESSHKPTILTKDIRYEELIGNHEAGLSHYDKMLANLMYSCGSHCSGSCQNGGYKDKDCTCQCPRGTSGSSCEQLTGESYYPDVCQKNITAAATIQSPGYPRKEQATCYYTILAPAGKQIRLHFGDVSIISRSWRSHRCELERIEFRDLGQLTDSNIQFCGRELENMVMTLPSSETVLKYHASDSYPDYFKGFQASITLSDFIYVPFVWHILPLS